MRFQKAHPAGRRWFWVGLFIFITAFAIVAAAQERVQDVELYTEGDALYLEAKVDFQLSQELQELVTKGVPLYFTADVEIDQERWWWFDKTIVQKERTWKLAFSPLTRQWRIGSGDLLRPEASLEDALLSLRHIRHWRIGKADDFSPTEQYRGRFRLRLDTSLLARPFQVDVLNRASWSLATPWHDFQFSISADAPPR